MKHEEVVKSYSCDWCNEDIEQKHYSEKGRLLGKDVCLSCRVQIWKQLKEYYEEEID